MLVHMHNLCPASDCCQTLPAARHVVVAVIAGCRLYRKESRSRCWESQLELHAQAAG